jgi:diguanylate cyclase (GGDEF)-like protein
VPPPTEQHARTVLVCDHRGEGLEALATAKLAGAASLAVSRSLAASRTLLARSVPAPRVAIVDPLTDGLEELAELDRARAAGGPPATALLALVPELPGDGTAARLRALASGPWDMVCRARVEAELELRVERLFAALAQETAAEELRRRAFHDDLTDLLRARPFEDLVARHFSAAQRQRFELALVFFDLDEFKRVNREHDFDTGNRLIAAVGAAVRRALRLEDVAGRLGGDEFGVLLPYTGRLDAARAIGRLQTELRRIRVDGTAGRLVEARASIGFETFDGRDLDSLATLRSHAERAMLAAKAQGGDCVSYFRALEA